MFRVVEVLLWLGVAGLLVVRVVPQVRAALGWGRGAVEAPPLRLALLDGSTQSLAGLKGRVVLVNFWATWCPPCRAEMPGLESIYESRRDSGFTVLGISLDEKPAAEVAAFLRDHGIAYPVAMATPEAVTAFGGVTTLPTSYLVDRRGRVRYTVQGMFVGLTLRSAVDRLLAER